MKSCNEQWFSLDEELTMFDLLVKDSLTKEEIKQVKSWRRQCLQRSKLASTSLTIGV